MGRSMYVRTSPHRPACAGMRTITEGLQAHPMPKTSNPSQTCSWSPAGYRSRSVRSATSSRSRSRASHHGRFIPVLIILLQFDERLESPRWRHNGTDLAPAVVTLLQRYAATTYYIVDPFPAVAANLTLSSS